MQFRPMRPTVLWQEARIKAVSGDRENTRLGYGYCLARWVTRLGFAPVQCGKDLGGANQVRGHAQCEVALLAASP